ncbi:5'-deoxynucleotidase [Methylomicrobium sp. Wu6]|uniref:5'-deoxynucleotidase n=1 Tax=Methylomicrobium sp. Wu6 TaxID=3107928 RepID=UPI002DD62FC9|nr:5'-deoxynucleotidase [Methylomicrobium sp. Wu6]MEC4747527.1 5'-deoxynucleotidase [Methylomicrobium sp. Wu6]
MNNSAFFAYLTRLRWITRWGLMRNANPENVMEHSWEVAVIAHTLALIKNRYFGGQVDANAVTTAALYHDVTEVITGDLPTPIKYHSTAIQQAYKAIEQQAAQALLKLLPEDLQTDFQPLFSPQDAASAERDALIKMADKISAYLKCKAELQAGNQEYSSAAEELLKKIQNSPLPEVDYFMKVFAPACGLTLDQLMKPDAVG